MPPAPITVFDRENQGIERAKLEELKKISKSLEVIANALSNAPKNETLDAISCTLATIVHEGIITR